MLIFFVLIYSITYVYSTSNCCKGYFRVGGGCFRDFCRDLHCSEDPNATCVVIKRCGSVFPIFISQQGVLSKSCTQPKEAEPHLCWDDDVCSTDLKCAGHNSEDVFCLGTSGKECGCSSSPVWYSRNDYAEADC